MSPQPPQSLPRRFRDFFYAEEVPYGLALVRITLPLALLTAFLPRWPHARELFSTDGSPTPVWNTYGFPDMLPVPGGTTAVALCTLLIVSLVTTSIGWFSRLSSAVALVLLMYLSGLDTIGTLTKYTAIAAHVLLLLSVSRCGDVWSVDAWLRGRRSHWPLESGHPRSAVWPRRLIQLMIGFVYLAAAITKMQTPVYFTGDQMLFWLMSNSNWPNPLGEVLSLYPSLIVISGWGAVLWEATFVLLCWRGVRRLLALSIGVVFHIMTALLLGLYVFPLVCLSIYFAFLDEHDVQRIAAWLRRRSRSIAWLKRLRAHRAWQWQPVPPRSPHWSAAALAGVCALTVAVGLEAEHRLDPYQLRGPDGPLTLTPLPSDEVERLLRGTNSLRPKDQYLAFRAGTIVLGGHLVNSRTSFAHGETAILQCSVAPPHDDVWLEVNLHDAEDRLIHRTTGIIPRDGIHNHFSYPITAAYTPGRYAFVMRMDGVEVSRRPIEITAGSSATSPAVSATMAPR